MADRRMFSCVITDSEAFLDLTPETQMLYFHLAMHADDDGFVGNPKRIQRMVGASENDLDALLEQHFVIPFDSGVCVIRHWRIHNYIRSDRYKETVYKSEKRALVTDENNAYILEKNNGIPNDYQKGDKRDTQDRLGKDRLGKDKKRCAEKTPSSDKSKSKRFVPPTVEQVAAYCLERKNSVDALRFFDFYASKGWMIGKNQMKDWKAAVRTWERNGEGRSEASGTSKKPDSTGRTGTTESRWGLESDL